MKFHTDRVLHYVNICINFDAAIMLIYYNYVAVLNYNNYYYDQQSRLIYFLEENIHSDSSSVASHSFTPLRGKYIYFFKG